MANVENKNGGDGVVSGETVTDMDFSEGEGRWQGEGSVGRDVGDERLWMSVRARR